MKTLCIIGNGTRNLDEIKYCGRYKTMGLNAGFKEFRYWDRYPDYYTTLEHMFYGSCFIEKLERDGIFGPEFKSVIKIMPNYVEKDIGTIENTLFFPYMHWNRSHSKQKNRSIINFGCTGANSTFAAMKILGFDRVILIGMNGKRKSVPAPLKLTSHHERWKKDPQDFLDYINKDHARGWKRVARWIKETRSKCQVLNASSETEIECFKRIKLGEENEN